MSSKSQDDDSKDICSTCSGKKTKKKWIKFSKADILLCLVVGVPVFSVLLAMLAPAFSGAAREKKLGLECLRHLKQISTVLSLYADNNANEFPDQNGVAGLNYIADNKAYIIDKGVFICPLSPRVYPENGPLTKDTCSYIYMGGFGISSYKKHGTANIPIVFDIPDVKRRSMNVLFLDGHILRFDISKVGSCKDVVLFLNRRFQYPPELLTILSEKAGVLDKEYGLK